MYSSILTLISLLRIVKRSSSFAPNIVIVTSLSDNYFDDFDLDPQYQSNPHAQNNMR